jgi:6-phosphogluconolactonase
VNAPRPEVLVFADLAALSQEAARRFLLLARDAVAARGHFSVALSGGSTPKPLYALLADPPFRDEAPWPHVHVFWADERCVPPDHPESNYRLAAETFLSKVPLPPENIHRMQGERDDPQAAAADYARTLRGFFRPDEGKMPRFDLILLGMGENGHTASLFPANPALDERTALVAAPYVEELRAHRLSLTAPVLNNARNVIFLVAGAGKAETLRRVLEGERRPTELPAQLVRPTSGALTWLVDEEAARRLGGRQARGKSGR